MISTHRNILFSR